MYILFWWWCYCYYTHCCTEILTVAKDIWTASPLIQSEPEVTQSIQKIGFFLRYTKYVQSVCACTRTRMACLCTGMCGCECGQITILAISVYCVLLWHWLGVDIGRGNMYFLWVNVTSCHSPLWSARGIFDSCF